MPYGSVAELPPYVRKLPAAKQRQWMHVFNSAMKAGDSEATAFKKANGAVRASEELMKFMAPGQARDAHGRWTKGGGALRFAPAVGLEANYQMQAALAPHYEGWASGLSETESGAIKEYTEASSDVNDKLRRRAEPGIHKAQVDALDSALAKSSSPELVTYRGLREDFVVQPGGTFVDRGYTSTSANLHTAGSFADRKMTVIGEEIVSAYMIAEIRIPKGTKAAAVNNVKGIRRDEAEVLVARGSTYKVKNMRTEALTLKRSRADDEAAYGDVKLNTIIYEMELVAQS